jgi:hypothetical protein
MGVAFADANVLERAPSASPAAVAGSVPAGFGSSPQLHAAMAIIDAASARIDVFMRTRMAAAHG